MRKRERERGVRKKERKKEQKCLKNARNKNGLRKKNTFAVKVNKIYLKKLK